MPVSVKFDPFSKQPITRSNALKAPQARVLSVLYPRKPESHYINWPIVTRAQLGVLAGYTAISGTVTRVLNGIRAGSTSGEPHPGLLARGFVVEVVLDIEGTKEVNYRITPAGISAYQAYLKSQNGKMPKIRDAKSCTNKRYKKQV